MVCIRFSALQCIGWANWPPPVFSGAQAGSARSLCRSPTKIRLSCDVGAHVQAKGGKRPIMFIIVQNPWDTSSKQTPRTSLGLVEPRAAEGALSHRTVHSQHWKRKMLLLLPELKKNNLYLQLCCQNRFTTQDAGPRAPSIWRSIFNKIDDWRCLHPCQLILFSKEASLYVQPLELSNSRNKGW